MSDENEPRPVGDDAAQAPNPADPAQPASNPTGPVWFEPPVQTTSSSTDLPEPPIGVTPAPAPRLTRRRWALALAAAIVVVALVAGFLTGGFGLLRSGGAATPTEEAAKVAEKSVRLFNSISMKNLLSNPLTAVGDLTAEIAPSEVRLEPGFTKVDNSDLLALTKESIELSTEMAGAFQVSLEGLKTEATEVSDDIALVTFTEGKLTVSADLVRLKAALQKVPAVASAQVTATLTKYGLPPTKPIDLGFPDGWQDDLLTQAKTTFPYWVDLADCAKWTKTGELIDHPDVAAVCALVGRVVVVNEGGRWYLSPMLTSSIGMGEATGQEGIKVLTDPERKELLSVTPARHANPTDAPGGLISTLLLGEPRAVAAELPLAERRYAAASGLLSEVNLSGLQSRSHFSEIVRSGQQAKIRVDQLTLSTPDGETEITDGTCVTADGSKTCLSDLKQSEAVHDMFATLAELDWKPFEDTTGISSDKVIHKLQAATDTAISAIDPSQIGLVVVQEDGSWLLSLTATIAELQNQLWAAARTGLISIQE
ncbi:hypothetical protein ATK74_2790 [Propionicimonas paludicola]|uniref:Uncharacterized protein n=1 Tax=Propionicimonas paludicola TaxID=185243 RepID=A0A2A9CVN2_9ACTN|nr:hypothetical protein [Propionicimonas paludicola]PFG18206.1 hypothetical protein ATK74_2790 [Propionicimonas paludicola]